MPDWITAPARGLSFLFLWMLVIAWSIGAPIGGILLASVFLLHPSQRILVPLSLLATIYLTVRVARWLLRLGERALND